MFITGMWDVPFARNLTGASKALLDGAAAGNARQLMWLGKRRLTPVAICELESQPCCGKTGNRL